MLADVRVGQGFDAHAFSADPARSLVLGGVKIPGVAGLEGHSDADVVLHAVVDALLGAAGLGDLGSLVGVDEDGTAGASSRTFVAQACARLASSGWGPGNLDVTVVAERPRLGPHRATMRERIAADLAVPLEAVNVKATTTDGLGWTGRGEGIAAFATVLVHKAATEGPEPGPA